jgi:hypothetical protein
MNQLQQQPLVSTFTVGTDILTKFFAPAIALGDIHMGPNLMLNVSRQGLEYVAIDDTHTALIQAKLPTDAFKSFMHAKQERVTVPIPVKDIVSWMKKAPGKAKGVETAVLVYYAETGEFSAIQGGTMGSWRLPVNNGDSVKVPKLDRSTMTSIVPPVNEFAEAIKGVYAEEAIATLTTNTEGNRVIVEGYDANEDIMVFTHYMSAKKPLVGENRTSMFTPSKLKNMLRTLHWSDDARMWIGSDSPLIFEWDNGTGTFTFLLAPYIKGTTQ